VGFVRAGKINVWVAAAVGQLDVGMFWPERLLQNRGGSEGVRLCLGGPLGRHQQFRQRPEWFHGEWMFGSQCFLADRQRLAQQQLRLLQVTLRLQQ